MEKIIEKIETINVKYVAKNGKSFKSEDECKSYEFFIENEKEILSKIIFFRELNEMNFKKIHYSEVKPFDYCCLIDEEYVQYHKYFDDFRYPSGIKDLCSVKDKGLYFLDYSNAYSGGYGFNGWFFLGKVNLIKKLNNLISIL